MKERERERLSRGGGLRKGESGEREEVLKKLAIIFFLSFLLFLRALNQEREKI